MANPLLNDIETKLDALIHLCSRLQRENAELRAKEGGWQQERVRLIEKNDIARTRVESMIARLKTLEAES
ncbi:TIGR02449 family protein [Teredinibacter waterburyi]|uniref:TIGR02449 family protein n=1 Tax=Teredinibacter waterburyi TaxID=1500538 RepID=UPI00165F393D|nr:TIGR02449 family protein [Teredinibacter waterburyi]